MLIRKSIHQFLSISKYVGPDLSILCIFQPKKKLFRFNVGMIDQSIQKSNTKGFRIFKVA